ncbi:MAG: glycosyltransferase family 39 protein [Anaerolineae bacterium]
MKARTPRFTFHASRFLLLAILLFAAFLRFYRLDTQSFWNDEGNSARIAERTPDLILAGAGGDIHPPGYYLLLHYWRALFGPSEFALRSLSAVAGLVLVVFTYLLGRQFFGETVGLMAAFLGAISPFAVYYSQEARMYALLAAISAASTYLFLHFLTDTEEKPGFSEKTWFLAYVFTSAAGLYIQYAFPFVLFVHNGVFGLWWLTVTRRSTNRWQWLALWAGAQVTIVVLYLPWLRTAVTSVTGWSSARQTYELGPALVNVLRVLSVGITLPVEETTVALTGAGILLLVGLWPRRTDRTDWLNIASVTLYLLLPITLIFAFDLYKSTWLKFLVVVLPPFHLLLALGIKNLTQLVTRNLQLAIRFLLLASCVLLIVPSLHNLYFDPTYARDDYRQIAADIAAFTHPGDAARRTGAVILNAPNQWEVFTYYYPDQDVYPAPYRPNSDKAEEFLSPLVERYQRLFVLYWGDAESDPQRLIETQLAAQAYKASDRWYGLVRLATYGVAPLPDEPTVALDARFGDAIQLNGYALADNEFAPGGILAPGDILPVTLFWEAQTPIAERYKVTVQLLDGAGQLVAQHDTEPGDGIRPTTIWEPGQSLADRYGVSLPLDLPPGRYTLIVGLYHVATGERLPVDLDGESTGDHLPLCSVQVAPPR